MIKEIKLTKRYPHSRTEDIVDAYMRGWNDALDAVQNGKFVINDDRKTEPQTDCATCEGKDLCKYAFTGKQNCKAYEPQTDRDMQVIEMALNNCKALNGGCKNCDTDCAWK